MTLEGRRVDDPPPKQPVRFRLALAVRKYPVHFGLLLALLLLAYPVGLLVSNQSDIRRAIHGIQQERVRSTVLFCNALNQGGATNRAQNTVLVGILFDSVRQQARYGPLLRKLGIPVKNQKTQFALVTRYANQIRGTQPPPVNCAAVVRRVVHTAPQP